MSRGGTDWGTLALLGVGAVVVYELLGKAATNPAPTAPAPTTPTAPTAPTTPQKPPAERGNAADWWTPPALRMPDIVYALTQQAQQAQTVARSDVYRPSAGVIMSRTSSGGARFVAAQEARLQADDVAAALPATASKPIPQAQPADKATYTPTGSDYGSLANVQSQISQTTYQTDQTTVNPTESTVYADEGDQSRRRMGGAQE